MSYKYLIYGLKVESEIEIEEAYVQDFQEEPDLRVVCGVMPKEIQDLYPDSTEDEYHSALSSYGFTFRIANVADYLVEETTITVDVFKNADKFAVTSFLFGSAFGYCLILRKHVMLHGGAVSKYGKGIIITGNSGAGKSTVSDCLLSDGYLFIADDSCPLSKRDGRFHIDLAYPQQKLCRDAALNRGYDLSKLIYINEDRDKFALRLTEGFLPEGASFDYLFELVIAEDDKLSIRHIKGHEKLMLLMRNVYRGEDGLHMWGVPPEFMKKFVEVAAQVEIYQIARPQNLDTLSEMVEFIDNTVKGN